MENNWSIEQTKQLFSLVKTAHESGKGLVWAFSKMSERAGRSVNSVRNYYYSQLKMFGLVPRLAADLGVELIETSRPDFELFTPDEIRNLIETILCGKADGVSVRSSIARMAGGDAKKALRLQNKYRSMITHHRDRVNEIMSSLSNRGVKYYNPYSKSVVKDGGAADNYRKLSEYISSLDATEVDNFFNLLKKLFA
ncbi:MAG: hypothetical protein LBP26_04700 [Clostridiales bacterium]|jgi:hypothetical protein|nr:hypothetical protein [Clostridiales bacterium]